MKRDWDLSAQGTSNMCSWNCLTRVIASPLIGIRFLTRQRFLMDIAAVQGITAVAGIVRTTHGRLPMTVASGGSSENVSACLTATGLTVT